MNSKNPTKRQIKSFDQFISTSGQHKKTSKPVKGEHELIKHHYNEKDYKKGTKTLSESITFPTSNITLLKKGRDDNGNSIILLVLGGGRAFSIQVNQGSLEKTNRILKGVNNLFDTSEDERNVIEKEIIKYITSYGSPKQKKELKVYKDVDESKKETGLIVRCKTKEDDAKLEALLKDSSFYGEWNEREGCWFFPEQEDMYDVLESDLQKELDGAGISASIEGVHTYVSKAKKDDLYKKDLKADDIVMKKLSGDVLDFLEDVQAGQSHSLGAWASQIIQRDKLKFGELERLYGLGFEGFIDNKSVEDKTKEMVSSFLTEIKDVSLQNVLRTIIFSCSDIDWDEAQKIIHKYRPESTLNK